MAFLDVGQGDSVFIETPKGVQVLIDAGSGSQVLRELQKVMPFYDRSIDVVMATHPDLDHIGGIPDVFKRFSVGTYIETPVEGGGGTHEYIQELAEKDNVEGLVIESPISFALDGVLFEILFPDREFIEIEKNTSSLVIRVSFGEHSFLLTGDAPKSIERYLVQKYGSSLKSDVLKAGHHGSKTSSDVLFVEVARPSVVVVSAGEDNRYGHPHEEVLDRFYEVGAVVYQTAEYGLVQFLSDGKTLIKK